VVIALCYNHVTTSLLLGNVKYALPPIE